jgi:hypothetical protein
MRGDPSRVFFGLGLGLLQLVGYQFETYAQRFPTEMPTLRVTVAVITYNRSRLLRETLAGIVRQNYPADCWELLVIDNNSTDDTGTPWPRSWLGAVAAARRRDPPGLDHGRNRAIEEARGEVIVLVDDDILVGPTGWRSSSPPSPRTAPTRIGVVGGEVVPVFPDGFPPGSRAPTARSASGATRARCRPARRRWGRTSRSRSGSSSAFGRFDTTSTARARASSAAGTAR